MANDISGRPWTLDTATPGVPVFKSWVKIAHCEFSNYAAAGNQVILRDINGRVVWEDKGRTDLSNVKGFKVGWVQGLIPDTIQGGGLVIVYIE